MIIKKTLKMLFISLIFLIPIFWLFSHFQIIRRLENNPYQVNNNLKLSPAVLVPTTLPQNLQALKEKQKAEATEIKELNFLLNETSVKNLLLQKKLAQLKKAKLIIEKNLKAFKKKLTSVNRPIGSKKVITKNLILVVSLLIIIFLLLLFGISRKFFHKKEIEIV